MPPVAAHAASAAEARAAGPNVVSLSEACRSGEAAALLKPDDLPRVSPEAQAQYKAFWGKYRATPKLMEKQVVVEKPAVDPVPGREVRQVLPAGFTTPPASAPVHSSPPPAEPRSLASDLGLASRPSAAACGFSTAGLSDARVAELLSHETQEVRTEQPSRGLSMEDELGCIVDSVFRETDAVLEEEIRAQLEDVQQHHADALGLLCKDVPKHPSYRAFLAEEVGLNEDEFDDYEFGLHDELEELIHFRHWVGVREQRHAFQKFSTAQPGHTVQAVPVPAASALRDVEMEAAEAHPAVRDVVMADVAVAAVPSRNDVEMTAAPVATAAVRVPVVAPQAPDVVMADAPVSVAVPPEVAPSNLVRMVTRAGVQIAQKGDSVVAPAPAVGQVPLPQMRVPAPSASTVSAGPRIPHPVSGVVADGSHGPAAGHLQNEPVSIQTVKANNPVPMATGQLPPVVKETPQPTPPSQAAAVCAGPPAGTPSAGAVQPVQVPPSQFSKEMLGALQVIAESGLQSKDTAMQALMIIQAALQAAPVQPSPQEGHAGRAAAPAAAASQPAAMGDSMPPPQAVPAKVKVELPTEPVGGGGGAAPSTPSSTALAVVPAPLQKINSSTHPTEYAHYRRFCEKNSQCGEIIKAWQPGATHLMANRVCVLRSSSDVRNRMFQKFVAADCPVLSSIQLACRVVHLHVWVPVLRRWPCVGSMPPLQEDPGREEHRRRQCTKFASSVHV